MKLFKSRKTYYLYNPNTLNYERVYPSSKDRLFTVLRHLSTGIAFGVATFFVMMHLVDSPMESQLRKENRLLQTQYEVLSLRLNNALDVLDDIQQRDENLYRAMLRKQLYIQSNSLEELISLGKNQEERSKCIPAIQPISNKDLRRTASGYGVRIDPIYRTPRFHSGMDFSAKVGTEIYATGNGVVTFAAWKQGYGNCLIIDHGYGYQTLYGHMSKFKKRVGQKVTRGEVIGEVGNTGKSTGPHLHYEVIVRGKHDNPSKYYYMDLSPEEYDRMIQIAENHGQVMD